MWPLMYFMVEPELLPETSMKPPNNLKPHVQGNGFLISTLRDGTELAQNFVKP